MHGKDKYRQKQTEDKAIRDRFRKFFQEAWLQGRRKIRLVSNGVKIELLILGFGGKKLMHCKLKCFQLQVTENTTNNA